MIYNTQKGILIIFVVLQSSEFHKFTVSGRDIENMAKDEAMFHIIDRSNDNKIVKSINRSTEENEKKEV